MMQCFSWKRVAQVRVATCALWAAAAVAAVQLFTAGCYNYEHLSPERIPAELYRKTAPSLVRTANPDCSYDALLASTATLQNWQALEKTHDDFSPRGIDNGSYSPPHCNPAFSVALLVTYRNRQRNLDAFLPYMHDFLRAQDIHYKIFVIEQRDDKPWNKGALYNAGARVALRERWPCLLLADVDLLPLDAANLHACLRRPRHLSAALDAFRFVLPYARLAGGALALTAAHFLAADGFSDRFTDWGGEDDDFEHRLRLRGLDIVRLPRAMSRYTMLRHEPQRRNAHAARILRENRARPPPGYSAAAPAHAVTAHRLFTLVAVRL